MSTPTPTLGAEVQHPGIERACLHIALCNGGINRERSVGRVQGEIWMWLRDQPQDNFAAISDWLLGLSDEDLDTVCDGEESEMEALMVAAPEGTNKLLNRYFDEVC